MNMGQKFTLARVSESMKPKTFGHQKYKPAKRPRIAPPKST